MEWSLCQTSRSWLYRRACRQQTAVNDLLTDPDRTAVINTINFGEIVSAFLSLKGPEVANRQEWLLTPHQKLPRIAAPPTPRAAPPPPMRICA